MGKVLTAFFLRRLPPAAILGADDLSRFPVMVAAPPAAADETFACLTLADLNLRTFSFNVAIPDPLGPSEVEEATGN